MGSSKRLNAFLAEGRSYVVTFLTEAEDAAVRIQDDSECSSEQETEAEELAPNARKGKGEVIDMRPRPLGTDEASQRVCSVCGTQLVPGQAFCSGCGAQLSKEAQA